MEQRIVTALSDLLSYAEAWVNYYDGPGAADKDQVIVEARALIKELTGEVPSRDL